MSGWLARGYERLGWWWIVATALFLGALAQLVLVTTLLLEGRYLEAPGDEVLKLVAIGFLVFGAALTVTLIACISQLIAAAKWLRAGKPAEVVPEIWRSSIRVGHAIVTRGALAYAIAAVPFHLIVSPLVLDVSTPISLVLVLFGWIAVFTAWILLTSVADLMFRPLVRDLASRLPADHDEPPPGWRLRSKAVTTVPVAAFYGAWAAGAFVVGADSPEARLYVALGAATAVTVVFALPVAAIATGSILDPVGDLIAATRRVTRGQFKEPVPVLTDDELGDLARSFNGMQLGLTEREALRDQNLELVEELKASRARIVASSDETRRKVERDLHDGAQQHLVLLDLKLGLLERKLAEQPETREAAAEARADLERALVQLRDLAHGIYPSVLSSDGLAAALREAAGRAATPASVRSDGIGRYPPELEAAVYFCCLEALQNASKYAGEGTNTAVSLEQRDGELCFEVRDDGRGFDVESVKGSAGLQNMADRIGALGGELETQSSPGAGTRIRGTVPLDPIREQAS